MFIEKNEGCSHMMCGTRSGGRVEDALRNGGCAHEFDWNTMAPRKYGRPGAPYNERQVLFRTRNCVARRAASIRASPPAGAMPAAAVANMAMEREEAAPAAASGGDGGVWPAQFHNPWHR